MATLEGVVYAGSWAARSVVAVDARGVKRDVAALQHRPTAVLVFHRQGQPLSQYTFQIWIHCLIVCLNSKILNN